MRKIVIVIILLIISAEGFSQDKPLSNSSIANSPHKGINVQSISKNKLNYKKVTGKGGTVKASPVFNTKDIFNKCKSYLIYLQKKYLFNTIYTNYEFSKIFLDASEESYFITKSRLGYGRMGSAYTLEPTALTKKYKLNSEIVLKIPHKYKPFEFTPNFTNKSIVREADLEKRMKKALKDIRKSERYPDNPAWKSDSLPIVRIVDHIKIGDKDVLLKPLVKGKPIKELLKEGLQDEHIKALRDIYDFTQALYEKFTIKMGRHGDQPFSADIAPVNLMWVDDPKVLQDLGYKKPGFTLFEMDIHYKNQPKFIEKNMTFEDYQKLIVEAMIF